MPWALETIMLLVLDANAPGPECRHPLDPIRAVARIFESLKFLAPYSPKPPTP